MNTTFAFAGKGSIAFLLGVAMTLSAQSASAVTKLDISQQPLMLSEGVSPNLLLTLDDSGSMAWAYAPDAIGGMSGYRAARSNTYNPMYYNPNYTYQLPKKVSLSGDNIVVTDYATPSFTRAWINGYDTAEGTTNLDSSYRPQWGTDRWGNVVYLDYCADNDYCSGRAHYYTYTVKNGCPASPPSYKNACYTLQYVSSDEETNFAIWYSFYRNRLLATKTAANLAFARLPENIRINWQNLNTCAIGGSCNNASVKEFSKQHRVNFFNWLAKIDPAGGTPLHAALQRAGNYLKNNNSMFVDAQGKTFACRASYHVMMTDGMWNGVSGSGYSPNPRDEIATTLPDGRGYSPRAPYRDNYNGTLADMAYYYWATDARPAIENKVKMTLNFVNKSTDDPADLSDTEYWDPRNDPATWQHLVNFTVGLGLGNSLTSSSAPTWSGSTYSNIAELLAGSKNWPAVGNDKAENVYDLWHAAIDSRGQFFSADTPEALVNAFEKILTSINAQETSATAPAVGSEVSSDGTGLTRYGNQTTFDSSKQWSGDLIRTQTTFSSTRGVSPTVTEQWRAASKLNAKKYEERKIYVASGSSSGNGLTRFTWPNVKDTALGTLLNRDFDQDNKVDTKGEKRLNFLAGDRSLEMKDGNSDSTRIFRMRSSVLGDIVNSKPVLVGEAQYLPWLLSSAFDPNNTYSEFEKDKKSRKKRIYVGANDGMLHGFDAGTGEETFAFIPTAVHEKLNRLSAVKYVGGAHQFYVDGTPVVADALINGAWRTVLIGTLRAGGKGLFALDITDPDNIKLLWEFGTDKYAELGYTFGKPTVARLHGGKWAVVAGNGYGSENDQAALLIIDLEKGTLLKELKVQGTANVANGLSTPKLADNNSDGVADYAYAGDLQGNLWRFDLYSGGVAAGTVPFTPERGNYSGFQVSFGGKPLYSALASNGTRQPITAAPSLVRHPSRKGYIVIVGTGKYVEQDDATADTTRAMTLYGIWDTQTLGEAAGTTPTLTRSNLQAQTLTRSNVTFTNKVIDPSTGGYAYNADGSVKTTTTTREVDKLSTNPVDWKTKYGWYLDLNPGTPKGEMVAQDMSVSGDVLLLSSLTPNDDPCASGSTGRLYGLDPFTGGATSFTVFDFGQNGVIDSNDNFNNAVYSGMSQGTGTDFTVTQGVNGDPSVCTSQGCQDFHTSPRTNGRQNWRTIEDY